MTPKSKTYVKGIAREAAVGKQGMVPNKERALYCPVWLLRSAGPQGQHGAVDPGGAHGAPESCAGSLWGCGVAACLQHCVSSLWSDRLLLILGTFLSAGRAI